MIQDNEITDEQNLSLENSSQYFLFISGGDVYALDALLVTEIIEYQNITKVPMTQSCVKGVTNVRGNIIAVIDLLDRFELGITKITPRTSLAIIKKEYNDKMIDVAIIIDQVFEVDNINNIELKKVPSFGTKIDKKFIKDIAKYNNEDIAILNTDMILEIAELAVIPKG